LYVKMSRLLAKYNGEKASDASLTLKT